MTVTITKPQATLRELLAGLKKRTGLFGEQIIRAETATDFYSVIGQNRNRIINGAMMIDQRNAGASVSMSTGTYVVDRFRAFANQASKMTIQQNAGSVTPPTGFKNYMGFTTTSAYSSLAGDRFFVYQAIEGYNTADLNWGSATASAITLSFWARSSLTGTFSGALNNNASTRCYAFTYTINLPNTWEYKTITIPGDTSGTWLTDNSTGIELHFNFGSGSTYLTTANSWQGTYANGATGSTSVVGTNGATLYITGVQLEKGSVATPFEHRLLGTELALCQRYFQIVGGTGSTEHWAPGVLTSDRINIVYNFKQVMRVAPSWTAISFGSAYSYLSIYNGITTLIITGTNESYSSANSISIGFTHGGSSSAGQSGYIYFNNASARVAFSAEL